MIPSQAVAQRGVEATLSIPVENVVDCTLHELLEDMATHERQDSADHRNHFFLHC